MQLIIAPGTVPQASRDIMPTAGTPGWATDGNPALNIPATGDLACHYNMMMAEIIQVILDAGGVLDATNWGQLSAAIKALIGVETLRAVTSENNLQSSKAPIEAPSLTGLTTVETLDVTEGATVPLATGPNNPVQLAQLFRHYWLQNSANNAASVAASLSFTPAQPGIVIVNANAGLTSGILSGWQMAVSGGTDLGGTTNYGATSVGTLARVVSVTAAQPVTLTLTATTATTVASIQAGGTALFLPLSS